MTVPNGTDCLAKRHKACTLQHFRCSRPDNVLYLKFQVLDPSGRAVKVWVCGCSLLGIVGSNPAGGTEVCLL